MRVSKAIDTSGHTSVRSQITTISRRRPSIIMIYLDASNTWDAHNKDDGIGYLSALLEEFNSRCLRRPAIANRLKHLCIVLNKTDLISSDELRTKIRYLRRTIQSFKSPHWGGTADDIGIYHCISVKHDQATTLLDNLIRAIMTAVLEKDA